MFAVLPCFIFPLLSDCSLNSKPICAILLNLLQKLTVTFREKTKLLSLTFKAASFCSMSHIVLLLLGMHSTFTCRQTCLLHTLNCQFPLSFQAYEHLFLPVWARWVFSMSVPFYPVHISLVKLILSCIGLCICEATGSELDFEFV